MLAILDPLLFDTSYPIAPDSLNEVVRILRSTEARIPNISFYWKRLQGELIQPLNRNGSREIQIALDSVRKFVEPVQIPEPPKRVKVWDFRTMFTQAGDDWVGIMTSDTVSAN